MLKVKCHNGAKTETVTTKNPEYNLPIFQIIQCLAKDSWEAQISRAREVLRRQEGQCV